MKITEEWLVKQRADKDLIERFKNRETLSEDPQDVIAELIKDGRMDDANWMIQHVIWYERMNFKDKEN